MELNINSKGAPTMKIFWIILVLLAVPGFRPALAYEDLFPRQPGPDKNQNQSKKPGLQGKEDSRTKQRGQQRGQANSQTRPWEVRPWEQGKEDSKTKLWEVRPWDPQQKATEDRRRVGRKARKEQSEKKNKQLQEADSQDSQTRTRQRQSRWQRHQMDSQRYSPTSVR